MSFDAKKAIGYIMREVEDEIGRAADEVDRLEGVISFMGDRVDYAIAELESSSPDMEAVFGYLLEAKAGQ